MGDKTSMIYIGCIGIIPTILWSPFQNASDDRCRISAGSKPFIIDRKSGHAA
jgi:hypothetical protein